MIGARLKEAVMNKLHKAALPGDGSGLRRDYKEPIDDVKKDLCPKGGRHKFQYIFMSYKCSKCGTVVFG